MAVLTRWQEGRSKAPGAAVDLALVLAIDTSGSVSNERLTLQIAGYAAALRFPGFLPAVRAGKLGRIALTFMEWAEATRQTQSVGWRLVADAADRDAIVDELLGAVAPIPGWTSISGAIDFGRQLLRDSGLVAARRVIDVSSDGVNNDGRAVEAARDDAVAAGITINGLPILDLNPALETYYRRNVVGGKDSFVQVARDMESFGEAVLRKLLVEVAGRQGSGFG